MLRFIALAVLLAGTGVAFASDASFDQQAFRSDKAASAPKDAGAKSDAAPMMACSCPHHR
jgi:hypothetical protein